VSTKAIEKKANIDYLTGVYNRNYLEETVNQWLHNDDASQVLTCLALDIDNFKAMNDTYGHLFGDQVIQLLSQTCVDVVRKEDIVGRYGGDEFIVILKGTTSKTGKKKAEQLKDVLRERPLTQQNVIIPVEISIGVTDTVISEATTFKELFKFADQALYEAKRKGKNQVCVTV
jgi:diguanylate cyclase (GGDEF)-like protein